MTVRKKSSPLVIKFNQLLVLSALVVILDLLILFLVPQSFSNHPSINYPTSPPEPTSTNIPQNPGWLTYTNTPAKFSIEYPDTWQVVANGQDLFIIKSPEGEFIQVSHQLNPQSKSLKEWIKSEFPESYYSKFSPSLVSKFSAQTSSTSKIVHVQLPNRQIASFSYSKCLGQKCDPGELDPATFDKVVSSIIYQSN